MNLALPALILFVVLLPGFIFRSGLKKAESESLDFSPFGRVAAEAVLWAVIVHAIWLALSSLLFHHQFEPVVLMNLLSSHAPTQATATTQVGNEFGWVASYFVSILLAAHLLPLVVRNTISKFRLDREGARFSSIFRFYDAPWYYLLTGADFEKEDEPDLIYVSAIVEVAKEAFLYVGILNDFFFDKDGQLDRLILENVMRRRIENDKKSEVETNNSLNDQRFYPIDGDSFVLRYSEAITLNVQYVKLTTTDLTAAGPA
jgi:hypothetical protein